MCVSVGGVGLYEVERCDSHTQAKLNFVCRDTYSPSFSYCDRKTWSSAGLSGLSYVSMKPAWVVCKEWPLTIPHPRRLEHVSVMYAGGMFMVRVAIRLTWKMFTHYRFCMSL